MSRRARWMRRLVALAIVVSAAAIATAAPGVNGTFYPDPAVTVVHVNTGMGGSGAVNLINDTLGTISVQSITRDPACDPEVGIQGAMTFNLISGGSQTVPITCPGSLSSGMKRCMFDVNGASGVLTRFEGVCEGGAMPISTNLSSLDFGTVAVGGGSSMTLTLSNPAPSSISMLSFQTTDLEGNFEIGMPCNPDARQCDASLQSSIGMGQSTNVTVWCRPKSAGMKNAALHVASNTSQYVFSPVALMCMGGTATTPVFSLTGTPVDAGNVDVVAGVGRPSVRVKNAGGGTLVVTNVTIANGGGDWTYVASGPCTGAITSGSPCNLAANAEVTLELAFDPSAIGQRNASLIIDYDDGTSRQETVSLAGVGVGGTLELVGTQTTLDFGLVPVGTSSQLTFALANHGNRALTDVTVDAMPAGPPFSLMPASPVTVNTTADTTITATCSPTSVGTFTTTLRASSPTAFNSPPITIAATCEGTTMALYSNPTSIALGEIRTTTMPSPRMVSINGTSQLMVTGVQLETASSLLTLTGPTTGTTPLQIELDVTPTMDGSLTNAILVSASNGDMLRIPISGSVVTARHSAPAARSLGIFCVGQPTAPSMVALKSTGTGSFRVLPPTLSAGAASPFDLAAIAPSTYPATIMPGGEALVELTPKRQSTPGIQQDELVWTTDVDGMLTTRTVLSANFVTDGGAIAPTAIAFEPVPIHIDTQNAQTITLQNCDTTPITLDPPDISPPFRIESGSFPIDLDPNEVTTIAVGFHPTQLGLYMDTLSIPSAQLPMPLEVTLTGEGINTGGDGDGDPDGNGLDQRSFYACAGCTTQDPGGVISIVIALVCVLVPRTRRRRTAIR